MTDLSLEYTIETHLSIEPPTLNKKVTKFEPENYIIMKQKEQKSKKSQTKNNEKSIQKNCKEPQQVKTADKGSNKNKCLGNLNKKILAEAFQYLEKCGEELMIDSKEIDDEHNAKFRNVEKHQHAVHKKSLKQHKQPKINKKSASSSKKHSFHQLQIMSKHKKWKLHATNIKDKDWKQQKENREKFDFCGNNNTKTFPNQSNKKYYVDDDKIRGAEKMLRHISNGGEVKQLQEELNLSRNKIEDSKKFICEAMRKVTIAQNNGS